MSNTNAATQDFLIDYSDPTSLFDFLCKVGKFANKPGTMDVAYAFATILTEKKESYNLRSIVDSMPYKSENFDIVDLTNAMASMGYNSRTLEDIDPFSIDERLLPCIFIPYEFDLTTGEGEILTLVKYTNLEHTHLEAYSSKQKKLITLQKKDTKVGMAYFFDLYQAKDDITSQVHRNISGHTWFSALLAKFYPEFVRIIVISIILAILSLAPVLFIMLTADLVIQPASLHSLWVLVSGVLIFVGADYLMRKVRCDALMWVGTRLDNLVCNAIFEQLLRLPANLVENAPVASQISRIRSFDAVRDFFTGSMFVTVTELPFAIVIFIAITFIAKQLVFVSLGLWVIYIVMFFVLRKKIKVDLVTAATSTAEKQRMQLETLEKMESLKYSGMSDVWLAQFREKSGRSALDNFHSAFNSSIITAISQALGILAAMLTIYFGVKMIWAAQLTAGGLVATMILTWKSLSSAQSMFSTLPRFEQIMHSIDQINRLLNIKTEFYHRTVSSGLIQFKGDVSFSKVGIRYKSAQDPVFAGLDMDLRAGQLLMITGLNGTGKSTVLKLVNGLYFPQAGTIRIDGIDIRQIDPPLLRHNIGYLTQTPDFFFGTIAQNLRLSEPFATESEIMQALQEADLSEEISAMPEGIHTVMMKDSVPIPMNLSYKLNLARLYLSKGQILLLDEVPYALLNSETGSKLKQKLLSWKGKKTVIMVTHRNDYLQIADQALLMRGLERPILGTPEEILSFLTNDNKNN